ncbi:hypothetical protein ACOME3_001254 [Neoechinorhynchus agilis]
MNINGNASSEHQGSSEKRFSKSMDDTLNVWDSAIRSGDANMVSKLIKGDDAINTNESVIFHSPLGLAAQMGNAEIVQLILAVLNERYFNDETALHCAVRGGNFDACKAILDAGAKVNHGDGNRVRPIHLAASSGRRDLIELLINYGSYVNAKDGSRSTPLHHAILNEHIDVARWLVSVGANVNHQDENGNTPLIQIVYMESDLNGPISLSW